MNKLEFLDLYFKNGPNKIQMIFNAGPFMENATIRIQECKISLRDLLGYYVPKYEKNGSFDMRGIREQIADLSVLPLTVEKVVTNPAKWDLGMGTENLPGIEALTPIPLATALETERSLLLDSNHTIIKIISDLGDALLDRTHIYVVRMVGENLEDILCDFKILNRTSKK